MSKYFTLLTDAGAAAIANAAALGTSIAIEAVAVGDGGGAYYAPAPSQTALRREVWRGKAASVETDPASPNIVVVHAVIPPDAGGFAMREIGVFNAAGVLLAVGNMAEQQKAAIADGMSSEFHIRMELAVSHAESIQLTVDPYLILATKQDIQKHDLSQDAHGRLFDQVKKKLDSIPVYEVASQQEALDGSDNSKIMTPLRVKESVAANAPPPDIGGAIDARLASQQEAEAGIDNLKLMTPLRVKQSVLANVPPLDITAKIATEEEAKAGTNDLKIMTPKKVKSVLPELPKWASQAEAESGTSISVMMSPLRTKQAIEKLSAQDKFHTSTSDNTFFTYGFTDDYSGNNAYISINKVTGSVSIRCEKGYSSNPYANKFIGSFSVNGPTDGLGLGSISLGGDASGESSIAFCGKDYSGARNFSTSAYGKFSRSLGVGTSTQDLVTAVGKFNKYTNPASLAGTAGDIFVIGNGLLVNNGNTLITNSNAFRVTADGGVYGTRSYTASGADYAEYFEWLDQNPDREDRRGRFVTLDGDKIRLAEPGDGYILGVISATPSVIGDGASDDWDGKYQRDIFGEKLLDENGAWLLSPQFKPEEDNRYVPREKRPEWAAVGMMGKLVMIDDGSCQVNGFCQPGPQGIATASETGYRVIARLDASHIKIVLK